MTKDAAKLISGNAWGQGVALLSYVVLTRLYTPEEMGLFNVFYSWVEVLIILSTLKYDRGIVAADSDREAAAIASLTWRTNVGVSALLIVVMLMVGCCRGALSASEGVMGLLLPLLVFFCGTSRVYSALFNRQRRYGTIVQAEVTNSTMGAALKMLSALPKGLHGVGLMIGTLLGQAVSNLSYVLRLRRLDLPKGISREERWRVAKKYRNYPLYTATKDLINSFSYNLPLMWLALYFDKTEVGLFALALTFTFRPINVLNNAFEKVLYERTALKVREGRPIMGLIGRFVLWTGLGTLPLFVVIFIFADPLFGFLFSGRWEGCGYYVRCLLPWVYVMLMSTSLMFMSYVFKHQRTEFGFYLVLLVLRIGAMALGLVSHSFEKAILAFGLSGMVVSIGLLVWYLSLAVKHDRGL